MSTLASGLNLEVERSITAEGVVATLARLFRNRGEPAFIRSDNGPEFVAEAVKRWLKISGVETLYIEPGSPWENAYAESFIGRLGDELLKREVFTGLLVEAKVSVEEYREHHDERRAHSALGYRERLRSSRPRRAQRREQEVRSLQRSYNRQPHSHSGSYRDRGPVKAHLRCLAHHRH